MKKIFWECSSPASLGPRCWLGGSAGEPKPFVSFRMVELPEKLSVRLRGHASMSTATAKGHRRRRYHTRHLARKPDLEKSTPSSKGLTKPDNVCIDAYDIDGDGQIDFALGAHDWKPFNTNDRRHAAMAQTRQNPRRPVDRPTQSASEPTIHRIRFANIEGNGKKIARLDPAHGTRPQPQRATGWTANRFASPPIASRKIRARIGGSPTIHRFAPYMLPGFPAHRLRRRQTRQSARRQATKGPDFLSVFWREMANHTESAYGNQANPLKQARRQRDQAWASSRTARNSNRHH